MPAEASTSTGAAPLERSASALPSHPDRRTRRARLVRLVRLVRLAPLAPPTARGDRRPTIAAAAGLIGGFTLIEMLITLAIAGVLSVIALPSFQNQLQRVRRSDALVAMIQIQLAESRWRANGPEYGNLAEIGVAAQSGSGHYRLQIADLSTAGYRVVATAVGAQASDAACRFLVLTVTGGEMIRSSGPDVDAGNDAAANRLCWGS